MSELLVRRALEKRLAAMAGNLAETRFQNETREPPDETTPYQRVYLLPAQPLNDVQGAGVYCAHGVFQVSLLFPSGTGPGDAAAQAELLRSWFKRSTSLTEGGISVLITDTPLVASGMPEDTRWHVPVSIRWQAWVNVT